MSAPLLAIRNLFSSCVAKLVMHPTALHWTSMLGDIIWRINGSIPPISAISVLFPLLTARFPNAPHAARCTSASMDCNRIKMGSNTSRLTSRTSFSVISANARAALLCKSMFSEYTKVSNERNGPLLKKSTSERFSKYCKRAGIASRSFSANRSGGYLPSLLDDDNQLQQMPIVVSGGG